MRRLRLFAAFVCVSTVLGGIATAGPAAASAPPSNDTFGFAKVVPNLPFTDTVDTTGATSGPADAQLSTSPGCLNPFGPVLNKSVWYKFTAGTESGLLVNASSSSYLVAIEIATGTPGALTAVTCGAFSASIATVPGTTYYVNAFDVFGSSGGTLNINFLVPPPPPTLSVTATGGTVDHSGAATITFAYACTNATSADGFIFSLTQTLGRVSISGSTFFFDVANCDGTAHTWSVTVVASNGKFAGGKAALDADFEVCGPLECAIAPEITTTIQLRRSGG